MSYFAFCGPSQLHALVSKKNHRCHCVLDPLFPPMQDDKIKRLKFKGSVDCCTVFYFWAKYSIENYSFLSILKVLGEKMGNGSKSLKIIDIWKLPEFIGKSSNQTLDRKFTFLGEIILLIFIC